MAKRPALVRFVEKIEYDTNGGCWLWCGTIDQHGYGVLTIGDRTVRAHRFAFAEVAGRPIPEGAEIDHLCRVRSCVNPNHLEAVPHRVNLLRGVSLAAQRARQTHCNHGHPFTPENTHLYRGRRVCVTCKRLSDRDYDKHRRPKKEPAHV